MEEESTLALQIRAAVSAKVEPFEVEVKEVGRERSEIHVTVEMVDMTFGYRPIMDNGEPNGLTPEAFAEAVATRVQVAVTKKIDAQAKRDSKAAKRVGRAG